METIAFIRLVVCGFEDIALALFGDDQDPF